MESEKSGRDVEAEECRNICGKDKRRNGRLSYLLLRIRAVSYTHLTDIDAGVTMVDIETGYGEQKQQGVLCVIHSRKLYSVKEAIQEIDPKAFITITQINEVRGRGFTMEKLRYDELNLTKN